MEDGGCHSLFDFVSKAHKLIVAKQISINEWHGVSKIICKQMIESIQFIHSKNICHLDVSLENFVINDVEVQRINKKSQIRFVTQDLQVKLCGVYSVLHIRSTIYPTMHHLILVCVYFDRFWFSS